MAARSRTFSESWYRIAKVRASLRPTVRVRRQRYRGDDWYLLQDPLNNTFFRLRPAAWELVSRLEPGRTVEESWRLALERDPEGAPGQEETIRLLTQLHHANLLYYNTPSDSEHFFARYRKRKQRETKATLASLLFARIPLWDPDDWLLRLAPLTRPLFGAFGLILWLAVVIWAVKVGMDNGPALLDQAQGVLAPGNLILLYLGMVLIKSLHEIGHALVCRHYGGEVHTLGVMLVVFTPLPYMDATSSWAFRNRFERAFVGAAGMIVEIFIAALAMLVWANTGQGALNSLAYNMIFVASVSTLLFNANPLLRFDGYYILSDLLDVPNLYNRSRQQVRYFAERWLLGLTEARSPSRTAAGAMGLTLYAVLSALYRVVVFVGILLFVGDQYLILGLLMALVLVVTWGLAPPWKLIRYLANSPELARRRPRAILITAGLTVSVLLLLGQLPMPDRFRAPGVVQAVNHPGVTNGAEGALEAVLVEPGNRVRAGTPLLKLSNPELAQRLAMTDAQLRLVAIEERRTRSQQGEELQALAKRRASIQLKQERLLAQREALLVKAPADGLWVAPQVRDLRGAWLERGSGLGRIIDDSAFRVAAVVLQDEASDLFNQEVIEASVRLKGQSLEAIAVTDLDVIPYQQQELPSPALGWSGGGPIAVAEEGGDGSRSLEPFFRIDAALDPPADVLLLHGRTAELRLTFSDKPLLNQWLRDARQLLQRRYRL